MTTLIEPTTLRWTVDEYERAAELGLFDGRRVQLIGGEVIEMPAMGLPHVKTASRIQELLSSIFPKGSYWVRATAPIRIAPEHAPEPDLSVVVGRLEDYDDHPTTALLAVEVADTSLRLDRRKAGAYASAGVGDYWIVRLVDERVEVYRDHVRDAAAEFGWGYASKSILKSGDSIAPLARADVTLKIADFFPE